MPGSTAAFLGGGVETGSEPASPTIPIGAGRVQPLGGWGTLVAFAVPTLAMWLATRWGISATRPHHELPAIVDWFFWGKIVFAGLFVAALVGLYREQGRLRWAGLKTRFRWQAPTAGETLFAFAVLIGAGIGSTLIQTSWELLAANVAGVPRPELSPPFVQMEPITWATAWLLLAWLPLFFFNIVGEEFWWRGYLLPRQEVYFGRAAWLVHGLGLALFHLPLGVDLTIILIPYLWGLPWVVQRSRNLSTSLIVHGALNGGGFLLVALGVLGSS